MFKPLTISASTHFMVAGTFIALSLWKYHPPTTQKIDFVVYEEPKALARQTPVNPPPPIQKMPIAKKSTVAPRGVFGLRKNTLTTQDSTNAGAEVKQGNTIAKEVDNETLRPEDAESLPNPTDEFLVTAMPVLLSEVRIPYPPAAREAGVDGPVIMELLIDAEGKVRQVILISGPGYGLNEAALEAVKGLRFKPARIDQKSVPVKIRYTYRFVLENR